MRESKRFRRVTIAKDSPSFVNHLRLSCQDEHLNILYEKTISKQRNRTNLELHVLLTFLVSLVTFILQQFFCLSLTLMNFTLAEYKPVIL